MAKKILTADDLQKTLAECGFKEGDELELPSGENQNNEATTTTGEGDGGSGEKDEEDINHPKKKPDN